MGRQAGHRPDDGIAVVGLKELDAFFDQRNWRVGGDLVENDVFRTARGKCIGQILEQAQFRDDAIGNDQDLGVAETGYRLA